MEFGTNVKRMRKQKGITQAELARKVDCTQSMIAQIERGSKVATVILAEQIAHALECNVNELLAKGEKNNVN